MKKYLKILTAIFCLVVAFSVCFAFAACSDDNGGEIDNNKPDDSTNNNQNGGVENGGDDEKDDNGNGGNQVETPAYEEISGRQLIYGSYADGSYTYYFTVDEAAKYSINSVDYEATLTLRAFGSSEVIATVSGGETAYLYADLETETIYSLVIEPKNETDSSFCLTIQIAQGSSPSNPLYVGEDTTDSVSQVSVSAGGTVYCTTGNYSYTMVFTQTGATLTYEGNNYTANQEVNIKGEFTLTAEKDVTVTFTFEKYYAPGTNQNPITVAVDTDVAVNITTSTNYDGVESANNVWYTFTAPESSWYKIYSTDANAVLIDQGYDIYGNGVAGFEYYIQLDKDRQASFQLSAYGDKAASYTVRIEACDEPENIGGEVESEVELTLALGENDVSAITGAQTLICSFSGEAGKSYKITASLATGEVSFDDVTVNTVPPYTVVKADEDGLVTVNVKYKGFNADSGDFTLTVEEA